MASTDLVTAEAQWREQFAAMQAALANLKLPNDAQLADGDLTDEDLEGYSSADGGQDVWDFISEDDEDGDSSDFLESDGTNGATAYGNEWFEEKCAIIATKNGLPVEDFKAQTLGLISSGRSDEELQNLLTDLVGYDDFDFIIDVLGHKNVILSAIARHTEQEQSGRRLLSKAERDEALRRQDHEHKTAALAPSFTREVQYPHVYRSYAAGNTLSSTGKKYGLPDGHERKQFEKYEEYVIPAGKKGALGPGQKLVDIASLDGLCRGTFKGYKALNRMQSLVYPVGYKTSENMLICAPTGAVRPY
jgi:antiviral helicase SLH1